MKKLMIILYSFTPCDDKLNVQGLITRAAAIKKQEKVVHDFYPFASKKKKGQNDPILSEWQQQENGSRKEKKMPQMISKYPGSGYRNEFHSARSIAELERELQKIFSYVSIGLGLLMLYQTGNEDSLVNLIYDGNRYFGQVYFIRVTKHKIIDVAEDDLLRINEMIISSDMD